MFISNENSYLEHGFQRVLLNVKEPDGKRVALKCTQHILKYI